MTAVLIGTQSEGLELTYDPTSCVLIARLRLSGLDATSPIVDNGTTGFQDLVAYFADLAARWRGWRGDLSWESLEGDLRIDARHWHGHVTLRIELTRYQLAWDDNGWKATGEVVVDAGEELSRIARDIADSMEAG